MKFDKYFPVETLRPHIKYFVVVENELESDYDVFPSSGMVIGFQYKGHLSVLKEDDEQRLSSAGITGIMNRQMPCRSSAGIGSVLVYFTETGFIHFASKPAHELFDLSISLDNIFDRNDIERIQEILMAATTDKHRIQIVERFLLSQLKDVEIDRLILESLKLIYGAGGSIRIKELIGKLHVSQSSFEKRFRKIVGATPKKFASIVRFNAVLANLEKAKSLTEICYENNFFDQAHFIRDFKKYTGNTPESFKELL